MAVFMRITVRTVEKKYPVEYIREAKRVPLCTECNAPIRPGVSDGEKVDNAVITKAADEVQKADVLLCSWNEPEDISVYTAYQLL